MCSIAQIGREFNAARHSPPLTPDPDTLRTYGDIDAEVIRLVEASPWRDGDGAGYLPDSAADERLLADLIDPRRWAGVVE